MGKFEAPNVEETSPKAAKSASPEAQLLFLDLLRQLAILGLELPSLLPNCGTKTKLLAPSATQLRGDDLHL